MHIEAQHTHAPADSSTISGPPAAQRDTPRQRMCHDGNATSQRRSDKQRHACLAKPHTRARERTGRAAAARRRAVLHCPHTRRAGDARQLASARSPGWLSRNLVTSYTLPLTAIQQSLSVLCFFTSSSVNVRGAAGVGASAIWSITASKQTLQVWFGARRTPVCRGGRVGRACCCCVCCVLPRCCR